MKKQPANIGGINANGTHTHVDLHYCYQWSFKPPFIYRSFVEPGQFLLEPEPEHKITPLMYVFTRSSFDNDV